MSRNPYHIEGQEPTLRRSAFVFMDLLGYSDLALKAQASGTAQVELRAIHQALSAGRKWLQDDEVSEGMKALAKKDFYALIAFTDNIVIGWPIRDDGEIEFGDAFFKLGAFQFQMVLAGYFVRGALSIGDAYVDEVAVFGDALMESYAGESKLARDPRIILTKSAVDATKLHLTYYANGKHAPHVRDVLRDSDGQWFLNYLECVLWAEDDSGPFYGEFEKHKSAVEAKLAEHKANPAIWSKYAWVAGYHNFFCDLHSHHFGDEHKVDVELFKQPPGLIVWGLTSQSTGIAIARFACNCNAVIGNVRPHKRHRCRLRQTTPL